MNITTKGVSEKKYQVRERAKPQPLKGPPFKTPLYETAEDETAGLGGSVIQDRTHDLAGAWDGEGLKAIATELASLRSEVLDLRHDFAPLKAVNLPRVILPELHDEQTGRIDAQKVADFMGVPLKPLAEGLGLNYKAVHRNPSAGGFQEALRPVKRSLEILSEFFGPKETIRVWLNTPHPDLDGATSLDTILDGKAFAIRRLLENAWNGLPA